MVHCDVGIEPIETAYGDVLVVTVSGDLAFDATGRIKPKLDHVLNCSCVGVVIDLVSVGFIDSEALGFLSEFQGKCRIREIPVFVVPSTTVWQLANSTNIFQAWQMATCVKSAIVAIEKNEEFLESQLQE